MSLLTLASLLAALSLGIGFLFYLSQILIHAASHTALTYNRKLDLRIGQALSIVNFHSFEGWRALHMLHHNYTNSPGKDPGHPNAGESHWRYLFTALPKMAKFTFSRFFLEHSSRGAIVKRTLSQTSGSLDRMMFVIIHSWEMYLGLFLLVTSFVFTANAWGWKGMGGVMLFWVIPWVIGQILMADFNYRTHENRPTRSESRPYRGQDTNTLDGGIWLFINLLTLGMYRHQAHHMNPKVCLWWGSHAHSPEVISSLLSLVSVFPNSRKVSS